ncbi:MAG TPA: toll/interleukin-1 receptor domain-containing protein [Pyrinomonadaceae bacterium]|nr:toll/interleukin-1 receptor domain-containing protein [Pyrinomonadaceae bacterium]
MKVFISYSSKDEALASKLAASLEDAGLDAWYDKREILPGDNWAEKIAQGLKESNAMVVLLTPQALENDAVQNNISYALGEKAFKNRLIPVIIGDEKDFPADRIPWIFKRLQTITVSKGDQEAEQFKKVAEAIKAAA